jgi:anaerobic selenocysteine-containing dehydrogenase
MIEKEDRKMVKIIKSACQLCRSNSGACGIDVYVEDGKVVKIEGTKEHPANEGKLCPKGLSALQLQYHPNRLLHPLKRVGERGEGKWKQISHDEAMDTIATRLKEIIKTDGARAICWYKGAATGWEGDWNYAMRFMNALASPNLGSIGHVCHIARIIGSLLTYGRPADPDVESSNLLIAWGWNPVNESLPNHMRHIMKAKQRGMKLVVVDPRFSKTATKADIFVQIRPGSDGALALGMGNVIIKENLYDKKFVDEWTTGFDKYRELVEQYPPSKVEEITWVPASTIREIARLYATTKPASLQAENAIDQTANSVYTQRAISCLILLTGNLDVPGGNVLRNEPHPRPPKIALRNILPAAVKKSFDESISKHFLYYLAMYVGGQDWVDAMFTGKPYPIRATIVSGANPMIQTENVARLREALKKLDFLVVRDLFMSATAEQADIVLPGATFLERTNMIFYTGAHANPTADGIYRMLQPKVVEPLGESKSDYDFIVELAERLGIGDKFPWKDVEGIIDYDLEEEGFTVKDLKEHPENVLKRRLLPEEAYRKYQKVFAFPLLESHKAEFYSFRLEKMGFNPLPIYVEPGETPISRPDLLKEYPLICTAGLKPGLHNHSSLHHLPWIKEIMPEAVMEINPSKAEELGIKDSDMVVVKSLRGSIEIKARTINTVDPRVVTITTGWGNRHDGGSVLNELTISEERCPVSGSTPIRSFLVNVTKKT